MNSLNKKQKIIIFVALLLILTSFLFPHWIIESQRSATYNMKPFHSIFDPPADRSLDYTIDYKLTYSQMLVIVILAVGFVLLLSPKVVLAKEPNRKLLFKITKRGLIIFAGYFIIFIIVGVIGYSLSSYYYSPELRAIRLVKNSNLLSTTMTTEESINLFCSQNPRIKKLGWHVAHYKLNYYNVYYSFKDGPISWDYTFEANLSINKARNIIHPDYQGLNESEINNALRAKYDSADTFHAEKALLESHPEYRGLTKREIFDSRIDEYRRTMESDSAKASQ